MTTPITNYNDETTPIEFVFDTEFVSKILNRKNNMHKYCPVRDLDEQVVTSRKRRKELLIEQLKKSEEVDEIRKKIRGKINFPYIVKEDGCTFCALNWHILYFYSEDNSDYVNNVFHKHMEKVKDEFIQSFKHCYMIPDGGLLCGCGYTMMYHQPCYY